MRDQRTNSRPLSRAQSDSSGDKRDRWLISYADLVTLLFALFVVLYAAADHKRARAVADAIASQFGDSPASRSVRSGQGVLPADKALVSTRESIDHAFASNARLSARARISTSERGIIVSLAEAGFFAPGDADMRDDATDVVDALADALKNSSAPIRVEGHTDSVPIATQRYPSNWALSAGRASSVLSRLVQRGIPPTRVSIAGFAGERPIADNSTAEGRAQNRRVDIVVLNSGQ
jgi:chemotaxis protein MotB